MLRGSIELHVCVRVCVPVCLPVLLMYVSTCMCGFSWSCSCTCLCVLGSALVPVLELVFVLGRALV